jgi:pimeloyl-ACP methyl ester carboxylesterase
MQAFREFVAQHPQPGRAHRQHRHWSEFDRGGHFAAMEAPDLLVDDLRSFFRPRR